MASYHPTERPRGGLSKADREYLLGERNYSSKQAERNTRARIRKRLIHSLIDFSLALEALPEKDRQQIFSPNEVPHPDLGSGLVGTLGFLYMGLTDMGELEFEDILLEGINRAEAKRGFIAEVDLDVRRRPLETENIRARMDEGEEVPGTIITRLLEEGDIDRAELVEYVERIQESEEEKDIQE